MRPNKFRAWDKELNCWMRDPMEELMINFYSNSGMPIFMFDQHGTDSIESRGRYIIQQYTGLKDKNGKEIYEGDICRCIHSEQNGKNPFEKIEQVYTRPGGFSLFGKPMQDFSYESNNRLTAFNWKTDRSINIPEFYYKIYDIEVIGNIWEHPTLLAEKGGENEAK